MGPRIMLSLAPLTWLIMSEIFPNRLRGKAMAVASVCVWTAASVTTFSFHRWSTGSKRSLGTPAMDSGFIPQSFGRGIFVFADRGS